MALGVLPYSRWAVRKPEMFTRALNTIVAATKKGNVAHERDAETRRNAVRALGDLCEEVAVNMSDAQLSSLARLAQLANRSLCLLPWKILPSANKDLPSREGKGLNLVNSINQPDRPWFRAALTG